MDAKQFVAMLNGREYGNEITKEEERLARDNRLVVAFGYSDDNAEFRGAINNEIGAYGGTKVYVTLDGEILDDDHDCDCEFCGYSTKQANASVIEFQWSPKDHPDFSWWIETLIPHHRFTIYEDGSPFCSGIVFALPIPF